MTERDSGSGLDISEPEIGSNRGIAEVPSLALAGLGEQSADEVVILDGLDLLGGDVAWDELKHPNKRNKTIAYRIGNK